MRSSLWLALLFACFVSCGCTGNSTGEGEVAATQSELDEYLKDNPSPAEENTPIE